MRTLSVALALIWSLLPASGATLEKLSLDQMIAKSTSIVRARAHESRAEQRGRVIYTFTRVDVLEQWKGAEESTIDVATPGGAVGGMRQIFSGTPDLQSGQEYVLFLWRGSNGITQIIGLSQGLFTLEADENGQMVVHRAASGEVMLDGETGQRVQDQAMTLDLGELRSRVDTALGAARR